MNARTLVLCACCAPLFASAQSLNIGPNGAQMSDNGRMKLAPETIRLGQALEMSELPVAQSPATFFLNFGTSGRSGPFELADGAAVGSKQNPYTLHMVDHGLRFTLHSAADTNVAFGPFTATNGAPVVLGKNLMTVVRPPPSLLVSINHANRIAQSPSIGIAPYNRVLVQELYAMRAKYAGIVNRVNNDTASVSLEGVPRIHSFTGNSSTPVIKVSSRDKQNAAKGAELSAMAFLNTLFAQCFSIHSQAITEGPTYHFQMPPGDYVLCATQRVKDPTAPSQVGSLTAVWWTAFHFDGEHPLSLALTADNAITWREIFTLEKKP